MKCLFTRCFAAIAVFFFAAAADAQVGYSLNTLTDGNGNPILSKKATAGEATYLFNKDFLDGLLFIEGNTKPVTGTRLKLNLQNNRVFYLDKEGNEMELTSPVNRIEFTGRGEGGANAVFVKGLPPIEKLTADTYYLQLVSGKAQLLMNTTFSEVEYKEYNSASTVRRTDKLTSYYGYTGKQFAKLARPEDVLLLLNDKTREVSAYIKKEKLKLKKQADLEKLFVYYNTL
ncbi:MAG TPA: hypothetical protein VF408_02230 [Sediminibacterium sp.]|jgi:hypothetical protein